MVIGATKLAAMAVAGFAAIGSVSSGPCCPTETISCLAGAVSFPQATCNIQVIGATQAPAHYKKVTTGTIPTGFSQLTIKCPPGEFAISGGYRFFDLTQLGKYTVKEIAPLAPSNGFAIGYQYIARTNAIEGAVFKFYVTCQGAPA